MTCDAQIFKMHVGFFNLAKYIKKIVTVKGRLISKIVFSPRYLLATNVGISMVLSGVGDVLEQNYEIMTEEIDKWDAIRTKNMSISGCTVGILCHYWYNFLDYQLPGRSLKIVAKKVFLDQVLCSPVTISVFFLTLAILERTSVEDFITEVKKKAWRLYAAEWIIWPPAQIINFYILPTKYRVLYDNTISLGYDVYTSYVKHDNS